MGNTAVTVLEEVTQVVVQETVTGIVEIVLPGPQGPVGDIHPSMPGLVQTATDAATSATASALSADTSEANASASAAAALVSQDVATTKATEAASSASNAAASETVALASKNAAAASEASALASENAAAASATSASDSATTATSKASEASASATAAAGSATSASTSATEASASATSASGSAATATTKAGEASTSATSAASSAGTATTKASEAATSATGAAGSATTASTKASEASTSATNAAASATAAATSATNTANALVGERSAVATLTNKTITGGTVNPATLQEGGVDAVIQSDIGTGPNQIPLNQYLGPLAFSTDSPTLSGLSLTGPFGSRVVNGTVMPVSSYVFPPEFKLSASANAAQTATGNYFYGTFVDDRTPAGGGSMFAAGYQSVLNGYTLDPAGRVALTGFQALVRRNNALDVGSNTNPASYLVGFRSIVQQATAVPSTVATGQALGVSSAIASQSGTIVEATGYYSTINMVAAGTTAVITNARGLYTTATIGNATGTQTVGSYYDAYLDGATVSGAGVVTNKYGVYQTKADHINYFAGDVLVGRSVKSSGGKLEVSGNLVCQPTAAAPTLGTNGDMSFQLESNTSLKVLVRGSDGVTRSATLTLA